MKNKKISDFAYYSMLGLIILVSYLNFSALFFPMQDTNMALTILMTPGFSIPGDLYFWGQDFAGNLVPFLANILCISYRFPPAMAVSVVQYALLILGFFAVSTLFRSRSTKLLVAVIWFFPSWFFLGQLTTLFGIQMSLIVLVIYLHKRQKSALTDTRKLAWLLLMCITIIASLWVSDLSVISIVLLLVLLITENKDHLTREKITGIPKEKLLRRKVLVVFLMALLGTAFLVLAKLSASKAITWHHPLLNSPGSLIALMKIMAVSVFNVLIFSAGNITGSIYAWSLLAGIPAIIFLSDPKKPVWKYIQSQKWILFFTLNGVILFLTLVLSNWVLVNKVPGKYFSVVFISLWIAMLLFIESTDSSRPGLRKYILWILLLLGVVSCIVPLYLPDHLRSTSSELAELKTLKYFGLVGESSLVYDAASIDPDHIKAAPHDKEFLRNYNMVTDVFRQKRIYLVMNNWLTSFPDTISQYGFLMQRTGEPFRKAGYDLCRYERAIKRTVFPVDSMQFQGTLIPDSAARSEKTAMITTSFDRSKHFVYGPFIQLPKGKYSVLYRLKITRDLGTNNLAVLDVSANFGKEIIASRTIRLCDFGRAQHFEEFGLPFELTKEYEGIEFRIMYLGETDLYFDRVVLIEQ